MRNFGRLNLLDFSGEADYRPDAATPWRGRLNAATQFNILDDKQFDFKFGAAAGGLLPSGGQPGAMDFRTNLSFMHKYAAPGFPQPLKSGVDFTFNYGKQDPFSADSADMMGIQSRLVFFDMLKTGFEFYKIKSDDEKLPDKDLRFFLAIDFAPAFMQQKEKKKDK